MMCDSYNIAVYVMSCDKTLDVESHFVSSFKQFWSQCPYPIYFGVNTYTSHPNEVSAIPLKASISGW